MKEVTIVAYCDSDHDQRVAAGVERTVQIDGSKPVVLDLCDNCDQVIQSLLGLMEKGAVIPGKKSKSAKAAPHPKPPSKAGTGVEEKCPEKGCSHSSPNRAALGQHTRATHGKGLKAYKSTVDPAQAVTAA